MGEDSRVPTGPSPTESIPPSVLLDRMMTQQARAIEIGFARIDERMKETSAFFRDELAATRRYFSLVVAFVIIMLMARDFVKFGLEAPGGFRIETQTSAQTSPPVETAPSVPVEPAPSPDTSLVQ